MASLMKLLTGKEKSKSLFSGGMKIPKTAQDTIPFIEAYENGLFLIGDNEYTLVFAFENLDYSLLRETEQQDTYESYQALLNALPTDVHYQEFIMNSAACSDDPERAQVW